MPNAPQSSIYWFDCRTASRLLARPALHGSAGLFQLKRKFLSLKAQAGQTVGPALVLVRDCSIVGSRRLQLGNARRNFGHHILALDKTQLDVGPISVPLHFVFEIGRA